MKHSKYWIGTSWKMNKTLVEAEAFATALAAVAPTQDARIERFVIPPFTAIRDVERRLRDTSVRVGAQNMHWDDAGAWTGEISPLMLADCGVDIVELGHSERRSHFGETDDTIALKVEAAVRHGLIPLICIGESLAQRDAGQTHDVLKGQVIAALAQLTPAQKSAPLLFAYEPVWAIGENGTAASSEYSDARHAEIASVAHDVLGQKTPCLYGGSVNLGNCAELITCPHIDGLFIGRAAWQVEGYVDILNTCAAVI